MEVSQMNKTAILSFIIDEVALKCRNVSKNMRKRIHWMLEEKEIIVKKYDERVLILNGWVRVGKEGIWMQEQNNIFKGACNYWLTNQEALETLISLNNEVRCFSLSSSFTDPIEIELIQYLEIDESNYNNYSKHSFNKAKQLILKYLSTDQIKYILTRFKRIETLKIWFSSLESIDFSTLKIRKFSFSCASFKEPVYLPKEIDFLHLELCNFPNKIKSKRVIEIYLQTEDKKPKEYRRLIESLKAVKIVKIVGLLKECVSSLPSTVREIDILELWGEQDNLEEIVKPFPHLIKINGILPIEVINKTKLKVIWPEMSQNQEKFKVKPRKIVVHEFNAVELNKHPELFEKVEFLDVSTNEFNFELLPPGMKKIEVSDEVDEES